MGKWTTSTKKSSSSRSSNLLGTVLLISCVVGMLQILSFELHLSNSNSAAGRMDQLVIQNMTQQLQSQQSLIQTLQQQLEEQSQHIHHLEEASTKTKKEHGFDDFVPFLIRDSRRLSDSPAMDSGFYIYDYVDVDQSNQQTSVNQKLYFNGHLIGNAPCQDYHVKCYKQKLLQVLQHVLLNFPNVEYLFYMESDNQLCLSLSEMRALALQQERYFVATGVGFSGLLFSRDCLVDFYEHYRQRNAPASPDFVLWKMLSHKSPPRWSLTRPYLVQHSIVPSVGGECKSSLYCTVSILGLKCSRFIFHHILTLWIHSVLTALTLGKEFGVLKKHLPRCFEPHRNLWDAHNPEKPHQDVHGWDYFDYQACPTADIYPCKDNDDTNNNLYHLKNKNIYKGRTDVIVLTNATKTTSRIVTSRRQRRAAAAAADKAPPNQEAVAQEQQPQPQEPQTDMDVSRYDHPDNKNNLIVLPKANPKPNKVDHLKQLQEKSQAFTEQLYERRHQAQAKRVAAA